VKKTHITHLVSFCLGAVFAYTLIDFSNKDVGDVESDRAKLRAQQRIKRDRLKTLKTRQEPNLFQKAVHGIQKQMTGNVEIKEFEDENVFQIILEGEGISEESLSFTINNGLLLLAIKVVKESKNQFGTSKSVSSFSRSFYIPKNVKSYSPNIKNENSSIIIEFIKE